MKEENKIQTRREFFKSATKKVLPILGVIILGNSTICKVLGNNQTLLGCEGSCTGSCTGTCTGGCAVGCTSVCGGCSGCTGGCSSSCSGSSSSY